MCPLSFLVSKFYHRFYSYITYGSNEPPSLLRISYLSDIRFAGKHVICHILSFAKKHLIISIMSQLSNVLEV